MTPRKFFSGLSFFLVFISVSTLVGSKVDMAIYFAILAVWSEIVAWKQD